MRCAGETGCATRYGGGVACALKRASDAGRENGRRSTRVPTSHEGLPAPMTCAAGTGKGFRKSGSRGRVDNDVVQSGRQSK